MADKLDNYRLLGRSGLRVSPLAFGTMTFGVKGAWGSSDEEAAKMIDLFVDRGGNFIDTANFYAQGESERVLARSMKGRRERLVVSTKYSLTMRQGDPNGAGNHRKNMMQAVEESLRRLETDYIDLLYLHIWDFRTPVEEILRGFDDLARAGKILYAGISDTPAWQISRMQAIADLRGWTPLVALQIPYSLAQRDVERDLLPMAKEMGLGASPWSPLQGGVLTGKYSREDLKGRGPDGIGGVDTRKDIALMTGRLTERTLDIADVVKEIAQEMGRTPAQVALAWTLLHPAVDSTVIGARTFAQLEDNLASLEISFSDDHVKRLDDVSRIELGFPHDFLSGSTFNAMFGGAAVEERQG
jgi:aryl-alcohol dehydrogenase-like predicted oxidoreductase